jgi:hypothetical protein
MHGKLTQSRNHMVFNVLPRGVRVEQPQMATHSLANVFNIPGTKTERGRVSSTGVNDASQLQAAIANRTPDACPNCHQLLTRSAIL